MKKVSLGTKYSYDYSDSGEEFLLEIFSKHESEISNAINDLLNSDIPWPILYHLSPQRKALLDWYNFKANSTLLEIGAGCGATTALFAEKVDHVTAVELNPKRAEVIAKRHAKVENLSVIADNFTSFSKNKKFDYATLIGVLEYSGKFCTTNKKNNTYIDPYLQMLTNVKNILKDNGVLIIAIENRLGLKYLSGGKEDHLGSLFDSVNHYPNYDGVRTFSKSELTDLLNNAGFSNIDFYYPFPDYKMPYSVLNNSYFDRYNSPSSLLAKIIDHSNYTEKIISESLLFNSLLNEGVASSFAHSFLVFAKK